MNSLAELFSWLDDQEVTPNGLYVLTALDNDTKPSELINVLTEISKLRSTNHLCMSEDHRNVIITVKGEELLETVASMVGRTVTVPAFEPAPTPVPSPSPVAIPAVLKSGAPVPKRSITPMRLFTAMVPKYRELFPRGRNGSAVYRTAEGELREKFAWFFKEYPEYDWDIVLEATRAYLRSEQQMYIQTAGYFIKKKDVKEQVTKSRLASFCGMVLQEGYDPDIISDATLREAQLSQFNKLL